VTLNPVPSLPRPAADVQRVTDVPCPRCGCDDLQVHVQANRVLDAPRACDWGRQWFSQSPADDEPACLVAGQPATFEAGVARAAELLAAAQLPLVYGLAQSSCEAQRAAVALADYLGAVIDTPTGTARGPTLSSFPAVGEVTCTLGEIRQRCDLLVLWGADPAATHPRFFERYVSHQRPPACVVVAAGPNGASASAAVQLQIKPGSDFEAFWILRAILRGLDVDADQVERQTGVALSAWRDLAMRLRTARYGAILMGEPALHEAPHLQIDAFYALLRDLNALTRSVGLVLGTGGNLVGADQVLCWQTGFPFAVNLAQGYPRFGPGEYTAARLLERPEVDAALLIGADLAAFSSSAQAHLASIPRIFLGSDPPADCSADVVFRTAPLGLAVGGTVHRLDDVPLALRPVVSSALPNEEHVLALLEQHLRTGSRQ